MWFPISGSSSSASTSGTAPVIYTVRDLCKDALQEIGALGENQPMTAAAGMRALRYLRAMVRALQADRLHLYTVRRQGFPLVASQQTYTIGAAGDFVATRPLFGITHATILPAGDTVELDVAILSRREWFDIRLKSLTDTYPNRVFCEPDGTALATISVWPIPTTAPTLYLAGPEAILTPESLDTELVFPDGGYEETWRFNLAKRLCKPYGFALSDDLREDARASLATIRRLNDQGPPVQRGEYGSGGYDIRSNQTR